jgi:hypothetical protein
MRTRKLLLVVLLLTIVSTNLRAQVFYDFVGKSVATLIRQKGEANSVFSKGSFTVYLYNINANENQTFGVKKGMIIMAINGFRSYSESEAQTVSSIKILHYLGLGFSKQGREAGMTILKKGIRVLSIGYMVEDNGTFTTLVTALYRK